MENPTMVLTHGAFSGGAIWAEVTRRLQREGYRVAAPAIPLRGLGSDAMYLASFLDSIPGPVVLAAHSYGGAVITAAAAESRQVRALVYVAALQPDTGESLAGLASRFPGSKLGPDTTIVRAYPGGSEVYLSPEYFREVLAADLPAAETAVLAATQRPADTATLTDPLRGSPAWRTIPSWTLVTTEDYSLPPDAQRFMASRAKSSTAETASSHAVPLVRPETVADLILGAARATR